MGQLRKDSNSLPRDSFCSSGTVWKPKCVVLPVLPAGEAADVDAAVEGPAAGAGSPGVVETARAPMGTARGATRRPEARRRLRLMVVGEGEFRTNNRNHLGKDGSTRVRDSLAAERGLFSPQLAVA